MKKIFVIYCNPKKKSFSEAIANTYINAAQNVNKEVRFINVYNLEIGYYSFDNELTSELKEFQDNILWADELVFIYPVWWTSIPAKLKSIIESTFVKGVVAQFSSQGFPIPLLKGKTAVVIQTYDMPVFIMKYPGGDLPFKLMKEIFKICGIKVKKRFDFGLMMNSDQKKRNKWLKKIENYALK